KDVEETVARVREQKQININRVDEFLELAGNAWLSYKTEIPEERRDLLKVITSNREGHGKNLVIKLSFPFSEVANRLSTTDCDPHREIPRIWDRLLKILTTACERGQLPVLMTSSEYEMDALEEKRSRKRGQFGRLDI